MRVRVLQGHSVPYGGVWFNQDAELEVSEINADLKGKVEIVEPKAETKKSKKVDHCFGKITGFFITFCESASSRVCPVKWENRKAHFVGIAFC